MNRIAPPVIIEPKTNATSAVIWMHGLGADAHDFESIVPLLPGDKHGVRFVFPNAAKRPVTINGGYVMPAWYDIADTSLRNADQLGIADSTQRINVLIDEQIAKGIDSHRIVVAGFSQGGAMAIHAGLRYGKKLAGIVALSCYVLERDKHMEQIAKMNINTPVWMAHGRDDAVVSYALGQCSAAFLTEHKHPVTFVSYPMGHEVSMPEITALSAWLDSVFDN